MNIPGVNVLGLALSLVAPQGFQLRRFTGRVTNAAGLQVPAYAAAVTVQGSAQPVPQSSYEARGLDFSREYLTVYTSAAIATTNRDGSGDIVSYGGDDYVCDRMTNWRGQDGWVEVLAVKVTPP